MSTASVALIDYEVGNIFNLKNALEAVGARVTVTRDEGAILTASHVILPGVGAFQAGVAGLEKFSLQRTLHAVAEKGTPVLGICLGMQLLMTESEEHGKHRGLNLIAGRVVRFPADDSAQPRVKVPHMGWNTLNRASREWNGTILETSAAQSHVYFVHSYYVIPDQPEAVLARTSYAGVDFCSVVAERNVSGCQFHPERSGEMGLNILKQFCTSPEFS